MIGMVQWGFTAIARRPITVAPATLTRIHEAQPRLTTGGGHLGQAQARTPTGSTVCRRALQIHAPLPTAGLPGLAIRTAGGRIGLQIGARVRNLPGEVFEGVAGKVFGEVSWEVCLRVFAEIECALEAGALHAAPAVGAITIGAARRAPGFVGAAHDEQRTKKHESTEHKTGGRKVLHQKRLTPDRACGNPSSAHRDGEPGVASPDRLVKWVVSMFGVWYANAAF